MSDGQFEPQEGENTGENLGSRVVPGPLGGMIRTGGNPGNKGGTGRPPSALRKLARDLYGEYLEPTTRKIMDSENPMDAKTKVQVLDHYAKFGLGEAQQILADEMLEAVATACVEFMPDREVREKFLARLEELLKNLA